MANRRGQEPKSGGGGGIDKFMQSFNSQILDLAGKLANDDMNGIPPEKISEWKAKIHELSISSAVLSETLQITKRVIDSESKRLLQNQRNGGSSSSASASASASASSSSSSSSEANGNDENAASIVKHMNDLVNQEKALFNPSTAKIVKSIKGLVCEDTDEDIHIRENLTEETFKCPIMCVRIVEPVTNGLCRHVASRAGVQFMLRIRSTAPCFQSGCAATWNLNDIQADPDFEDKMERFYRQHERASAYRSQYKDGVDLDEDEEEL